MNAIDDQPATPLDHGNGTRLGWAKLDVFAHARAPAHGRGNRRDGAYRQRTAAVVNMLDMLLREAAPTAMVSV